jgi:hypothetical protein
MAVTHLTSEQLTLHIQNLVAEKRLSYIDAIIYYCESRQLDVDAVVPLIGDKIKYGLTQDAQRLHLIPKNNELPG